MEYSLYKKVATWIVSGGKELSRLLKSVDSAKSSFGYSLFSIMWSRDNLWELNPWYSCSVKSEKPQPYLHKETANWMIQRMTAEGCAIAPLDVFKNGKLEILIWIKSHDRSEKE